MDAFAPTASSAPLGILRDAMLRPAAAAEMQESKVSSSRPASTRPAAPIATIRVRGARSPHSSSSEMSTRLPTTCKIARRPGASARLKAI